MDKFFASSKTIQGIVMMAFPMLSGLLGWTWATPEVGTEIGVLLGQALTFLGGVWAFYGRLTATKKLSLTPGS